MTHCKGCGTKLTPARAPGREKKWCSERCRKSQYDQACVDCGARVSGTDPGCRNGREPRCVKCRAIELGAERKVWTPEAVAAAIRAWVDEYGAIPALSDWCPHQCRVQLHDEERAERWESANGRWPSKETVIYAFGSWNEGIAAAGFTPRSVGRPRKVAA